MIQTRLSVTFDDPDGLRLVGLGRIPRCTACPRYAALVAVYRERRAGSTTSSWLPAVPGFCRFEACAPLASRYGAPLPIHGAARAAGRSVLAS